ncbi:MAG: SDR family NAD(P)-dependent oxidoreductase [Bacteroidetes bacterium]|nr:MAG: SDR family NAD(P)-dependent oxidoreductase [Bacteroidota bacterium]TAF97161.1 MAG: SDR family NAD(P)-dependent oxidoreductase [Bacteroidota bacterium]
MIVVITGATSGFGEAMAYTFAKGGYQCILVGRRQERLTALVTKLEKEFGNQHLSIALDVQDKIAVEKVFTQLPETWNKIDVLINNAGLALGRDAFQNADVQDWETMIDTNVKGLLYVSKAVVPYMIANGKGHIINIGSTAAKEAYAGGSVYCATKAAVDAISKAQRIDLLPHAIKVTALHPGAADTEFSQVRFKGNTAIAAKVYEGFTPLYAQDVADIAWYVANLPAHVCINDLVVTCTAQANSVTLFKQ